MRHRREAENVFIGWRCQGKISGEGKGCGQIDVQAIEHFKACQGLRKNRKRKGSKREGQGWGGEGID